MWPRFWGASTKQWKDAGSVDSSTIGATEDAPARRLIAFQKPGGHCLRGHLTPFWQAEDPLGDDVPQHLGGARLDRVAAAAELLVMPPAVVEDPLGSEQLAPELRHALVLLRPAQLDRRAFRTGNTGALQGAERAVVRVAERLELDPLGGDALAHALVAVDMFACDVDQPVHADLERRGEREAERAALVQQRRHGHLPALALLAEPIGHGYLDVVEEDLVELRLTGDLPQRSNLDAGRMHVDDQVRQPLVARRLRVAERDEDAEVGDVGERRPDLLPVDDVHVPAALGARACRGEVGAGARLREALAPDLLGGEDLRKMRLLLRVRAVGHDRRPGHPEPDHADVGGRLRARHLLVEDRLEAVGRAGAAVIRRPGQARVAGLVKLAAPLAAESVAVAIGAASPAPSLVGQVRVEPVAQLGAKGGFLRRVAEIHETVSLPP